MVALIGHVIRLENVKRFETTSKYLISFLIQMASNTENDKNKPILVLRVQAPLDECQLFSYCSFMLL